MCAWMESKSKSTRQKKRIEELAFPAYNLDYEPLGQDRDCLIPRILKKIIAKNFTDSISNLESVIGLRGLKNPALCSVFRHSVIVLPTE